MCVAHGMPTLAPPLLPPPPCCPRPAAALLGKQLPPNTLHPLCHPSADVPGPKNPFSQASVHRAYITALIAAGQSSVLRHAALLRCSAHAFVHIARDRHAAALEDSDELLAEVLLSRLSYE